MKLVAIIIAATISSAFAFPFNDNIGQVFNLKSFGDCGTPDLNYHSEWDMWFGGHWNVQGKLIPTENGGYSLIINGHVTDLNAVGTYDLTNFEYWMPEINVCEGQTRFRNVIYYYVNEDDFPKANVLSLVVGQDGSVTGNAQFYP